MHFDAQGHTIYRNPAASHLQPTLTLAEQQTARTQPQEKFWSIGSRDFTSRIVPDLAEQTVTFYFTDVTTHRCFETQREAQRVFYETVLDEIPVEVVVLDAQFRYLYANPRP